MYDVKNFWENCQSALTKIYHDTITADGGWTVKDKMEVLSFSTEAGYRIRGRIWWSFGMDYVPYIG